MLWPQEFLSAKHSDLLAEEDVELVQNKSPKVDAKTLAPAEYPADPDMEWCACFMHTSKGQPVCTFGTDAAMWVQHRTKGRFLLLLHSALAHAVTYSLLIVCTVWCLGVSNMV